MHVEQIRLTDLVLDPANARRHAPKNLEAIKGSLARFGQQKPIVVGASGVVIAGNGTLEAARALGWDTIAACRTELNGTDAVAYAIADNRTGELAEWDAGVLSETLKSLQDLDFDLGAIGFDEKDLAGMISSPVAEGLTDPDRRCFGMEIDPKYCDVILTRWEQFTGKTASLQSQPEAVDV